MFLLKYPIDENQVGVYLLANRNYRAIISDDNIIVSHLQPKCTAKMHNEVPFTIGLLSKRIKGTSQRIYQSQKSALSRGKANWSTKPDYCVEARRALSTFPFLHLLFACFSIELLTGGFS